MEYSRFDVVIIGAGVVGLSVGMALLESNPNLKIIVFDKERNLGMHASGRNSGVLHAGFYYSPNSLKARFCVEGNYELKKFCKEVGIPVKSCGKIVVTKNSNEDDRLELLFKRGLENGVNLELLPAKKLDRFEPLAKTFKTFLWSPDSAIADASEVIKSMRRRFEERGGLVRTQTKVQITTDENQISVLGDKLTFKHLVNAAGAQADKIAKQIGLANDYAMLPFLGLYHSISYNKLPIRTLVYPVPHPINPFLGVHLTPAIDNFVKIGPTAIPIFGREQYSLLSGWRSLEFSEILKGSWAIAKGNSHDFSGIVKSEWTKLFRKEIVKLAAELIPNVENIAGWTRKPPGIRAQLVHLPSGNLEQDFVIRKFSNSTHILNAVSPGWTSALPFGRYVATEFVLPALA